MNTAPMTKRNSETSPRPKARIAGRRYLRNILAIIIAVFLFRGLIVSGNAAANVLAHQPLVRSGVASEIASTVRSIVVADLFHDLFKPANRSFSLLAVSFRLVACATAVLGYLLQLAPAVASEAAHSIGAFEFPQLCALAPLFFTSHSLARA